MRSASLLILLLGCGVAAMSMPVAQPAPIPDCSLDVCAAIDLGDFGAPNETMQGLTFDVDAAPAADPPATLSDLDNAPLFASVTVEKPFLRGPEPPAAILTLSGFACIAILSRRRRLACAIQHSRRRVYTIRRMA